MTGFIVTNPSPNHMIKWMEVGGMPTINNIFNVKISSVSNNASVNFGNTLHKGHSANQKSVGGSEVVGDGSISSSRELNAVRDPDWIDQPNKQF